jgi:hypothetical protein
MNVNSIKNLVQKYNLEEIQSAENSLINELSLDIEVEGKDEGEQLTHILAAIFCKQEMVDKGISINHAIRIYSQRVRGSIN